MERENTVELQTGIRKWKKYKNDESGEAESSITHHYLILKMKTRNGEELARQEKERKVHLNIRTILQYLLEYKFVN